MCTRVQEDVRDAAVHERIDDDERERMMSFMVVLQQRRRSASTVSVPRAARGRRATLHERNALCLAGYATLPYLAARQPHARTGPGAWRRLRPAMRATVLSRTASGRARQAVRLACAIRIGIRDIAIPLP